MASSTKTEVPIKPEATYQVIVSRPFYALGVRFSPLDVEVHLSGALLMEFKDCISGYTEVGG